jgi:hypothetical protein
MKCLVEIRAITLTTGARDRFHRLYVEEALPRLRRWGFDVVTHGPSLHDDRGYFVVRRFDSLRHRQESEDAYYASDDWRRGPREAMLALMDGYTDVVLELDPAAVEAMRT